jgi:hypothetical protein
LVVLGVGALDDPPPCRDAAGLLVMQVARQEHAAAHRGEDPMTRWTAQRAPFADLAGQRLQPLLHLVIRDGFDRLHGHGSCPPRRKSAIASLIGIPVSASSQPIRAGIDAHREEPVAHHGQSHTEQRIDVGLEQVGAVVHPSEVVKVVRGDPAGVDRVCAASGAHDADRDGLANHRPHLVGEVPDGLRVVGNHRWWRDQAAGPEVTQLLGFVGSISGVSRHIAPATPPRLARIPPRA